MKRWASDLPEFRRRVIALRSDMTERLLGQLANGMCAAADVLREIGTKSNGDAIRVKACEILLTHGVRVRESAELAARIAALEERK